MHLASILALAAALAGPAAGAAEAGPGPAARAPAPPERPLSQLPYTPGLDPAAMDRGADPCVDFYRYACGGWLDTNPIPPDEARWDVYRKLAAENRQFLWGLLEQAARSPSSPAERLAGDYFAACVDEQAVERAGDGPLRADLAAVAGLRSRREIAALLGRLQPEVSTAERDQAQPPRALAFGIGAGQDGRDARRVIGVLLAGGLGLPDRDSYLAETPRARDVRARYAAYLAELLRLAGDAPAAAGAGAEAALRLETALARASLTPEQKREPYNVFHPLSRAQLQALTPAFDWAAYFAASKAPARLRTVNVTELGFFIELDRLLTAEPLDAWRAYLRTRLSDIRAPYLARPWREAHFAFHDGFLQGVREPPPRWKRCVEWVDRDLGDALGRIFVARAFPPEVKAQVTDMTRRIQAAMAQRIREADWMTPPTRQAALAKLAAVRNKIGYPARWRDYGGLVVRRGDLAGNVARAARFEAARQFAKVGRPVDRDEWSMTAPTVNAYYDAQMNDVNFPAGVLLPPLWDPRMDLAPGYGDTGATIGHELTHGFDDEGRRFDARGDLRDWWTARDDAEFKRRAACVIEQFGQFTAVDDVKVNSRLTVGEDVADLGGTTLAWMAWRDATRGQELPARDGLTPAQRFFVGNAQWACENETDALRRIHAATNPHSPARWRVDGLFANMPEFREAFGCRVGQPMAPEKMCRVW